MVQQESLGMSGAEEGVAEWRGSQGWHPLPGTPFALAARCSSCRIPGLPSITP